MLYWTLEDGNVVLFLVRGSWLSNEDRLRMCRLFRKDGIFKLKFLLDATPQGLLHELIAPKQFQTSTSNYYVFPCEQVEKSLEWKSPCGLVTWDGEEISMEGDTICGQCFLGGRIEKLKECEIHTKKRIREEIIETKFCIRTSVQKEKRKCLCGIARPNFNVLGETKPIWCSACPSKAINAVNVTNKKCVCGIAQPSLNVPGGTKPIWCSACPTKSINAVNVTVKKCVCGFAIPYFNVPGATKPIWCSACPTKAVNAVNVKDKKCVCGIARPSLNVPGETKPIWCSACPAKDINAVNVKDKKCVCGIAQPSLNVPGETKPIWCSVCPTKAINAVNVKAKKCVCGIAQPSLNVPGETKPIWCSICPTKAVSAVNVKNKKCLCGIAKPSFNVRGETKPIWCPACPTIDGNAVNVLRRYCECSALAYYGFPGEMASRCVQCKSKDMVRHPRKKCQFKNCKELALYGLTSRERCENHKNETDLNLVEQRCYSCGLFNVLNIANNCFACDPTNFQKFAKRKENAVKALLDANKLVYVNDKIPNGSLCGKERPDFVFRCGTHIVILEVDENQHSNYQCLCEQTRMVNVTQTFGGMPVLWIRYNPDAFKANGAMKKQGVSDAQRQKCLLKWLKWAFTKDMHNLGEVVYLCYDDCDVTTMASEVYVLPSI